MAHDISWINTTKPTVEYDWQSVETDTIEHFTAQFERDHGLAEGSGDDIGGLIVYSDRCVYDYENFCGWVR